MTDKNSNNTLVDQKQALSLFLESLLTETESSEMQVESSVVVPVETPEPETAPEPELESVPEPVPVVTAEPVISEPVVETPTESNEEVALEDEVSGDFGMPDWSAEPFQALMFSAGGLTLAVPLVELNGVVEWPENITEMPGHADFYLGLVQNLDRQVAVVDTARLVLPDEHLERLEPDATERVTRIVLIDEGRWGLACDSVAEVVTLTPDDVRWRTRRNTRPWLAGTVIEHMCALIDGSEFARLLRAS